ncbi:MAG: hypothetical protein HY433_03205 [Candidatus Liptonbacteria bacterium]|nr:hypothetical protein [Candidatus Liptonbacteria bacterium]
MTINNHVAKKMRQVSDIRGQRLAFTLIETIVYLGLFSMIISMSLVALYQILGSENQHRNRVEVDAEANFMMQKIQWALTGAQAINQPAVNATGTTLSVDKFNYSQNPVVLNLDSRNVSITKGASSSALLGSGRVYVNQLMFEHLPSVQGAPEGVKVTFSVVSFDIERSIAASTTIQDTLYLRK